MEASNSSLNNAHVNTKSKYENQIMHSGKNRYNVV